jgi:hypothetical protein
MKLNLFIKYSPHKKEFKIFKPHENISITKEDWLNVFLNGKNLIQKNYFKSNSKIKQCPTTESKNIYFKLRNEEYSENIKQIIPSFSHKLKAFPKLHWNLLPPIQIKNIFKLHFNLFGSHNSCKCLNPDSNQRHQILDCSSNKIQKQELIEYISNFNNINEIDTLRVDNIIKNENNTYDFITFRWQNEDNFTKYLESENQERVNHKIMSLIAEKIVKLFFTKKDSQPTSIDKQDNNIIASLCKQKNNKISTNIDEVPENTSICPLFLIKEK